MIALLSIQEYKEVIKLTECSYLDLMSFSFIGSQ